MGIKFGFVDVIEGEYKGYRGLNINIDPVKTVFVELFKGEYWPTGNWQHIPKEYVKQNKRE